MCVNNLPRVVTWKWNGRDILIASHTMTPHRRRLVTNKSVSCVVWSEQFLIDSQPEGWLWRRTLHYEVAGSTTVRFTSCNDPGKLFTHTHASVTKQYNLVLNKGHWCSAAGTLTAGLAESNGSLSLGLWRSYLPRDWDQPGPTLVSSTTLPTNYSSRTDRTMISNLCGFGLE